MPLPAAAPTQPLPPPADPDDDDDLEDDDDDDDDDDDMDVYDDDDSHPHPHPDPSSSSAPPPPPPDDDPNSSPSSSTDDDDRIRSVNGTSSAVAPAVSSHPANSAAVLSLAAVAPESSRPSRGGEEERRSFSSIEERRLFQRLWTDEDEIAILEGFYEFTSRRGTTHHAHQHDTGPFYEQIKNRLQLDFTKNQLVEKIRRLKKKYRNVVSRMSSGRDFAFKSPHERAIYDIARRIWSASVGKKSSSAIDHDDNDDGLNDHLHHNQQPPLDHHRVRRGVKRPAPVAAGLDAVPVEVKSVPAIPASVTPPPPPPPLPLPPSQQQRVVAQNSGSSDVVEETVRSCFSPLVKDLVQYAISGAWSHGGFPGGPLMGVGMVPLAFAPVGSNNKNSSLAEGSVSKDAALDGRWRKQQILELEVYSKRLELVQELIKVKLEELRSLG